MARRSTAQKTQSPLPEVEGKVVETTLLELVQTVGELTQDDREVVATVIEMLHSGRVRLIGNFRGQRIAIA
jgi:predicted nucleic-acid-binding protein